MVRYLFVGLLCLLLCSCAVSSHYSLPQLQGQGQCSAVLWYTKGKMVLPLIAGMEWQQKPKVGTSLNLGLTSVQGILFAQCTYAQGALLCTTQKARSGLHTIAESSAVLLVYVLSAIQQGELATPAGWQKAQQQGNEFSFYHKNKEESMTVQVQKVQPCQ
jgi:hypothetical protein